MLAGEIRKGATFEFEGNVYKVVDFMHVKPGKGSAFVRTTLKNVITGKNLDRTFNPTEKLEDAQVDKEAKMEGENLIMFLVPKQK